MTEGEKGMENVVAAPCPLEFRAHHGSCTNVCSSFNDGSMITTGGQDSMVVQWKVTIDMLEETAALVSKTSTDVSSLMEPIHFGLFTGGVGCSTLQRMCCVVFDGTTHFGLFTGGVGCSKLQRMCCVVFDLVPILLASLQWMVPD